MKIEIRIKNINLTPPLEVMERVISKATLSVCRKVFLNSTLKPERLKALAEKNGKAAARSLSRVLSDEH